MPQKGELLGRVIKLVGGDNIIVKCTDGKVRTCRIRGKIKRITMPLKDDHLLYITTEIEADHSNVIRRVGEVVIRKLLL